MKEFPFVNQMALDLSQISKAGQPIVLRIEYAGQPILGKVDFAGNDYVIFSAIFSILGNLSRVQCEVFQKIRIPITTIQAYRLANEKEKQAIQKAKEAEKEARAQKEEDSQASQKHPDS